jgi:hypothetical protein
MRKYKKKSHELRSDYTKVRNELTYTENIIHEKYNDMIDRFGTITITIDNITAHADSFEYYGEDTIKATLMKLDVISAIENHILSLELKQLELF